MKRIVGYLLLLSLLLTGCFGKKEAEVIQGEVSLATNETKVFSNYQLTNISDEQLVIDTRDARETLVLVKKVDGQGATNVKVEGLADTIAYQDKDAVNSLKAEGLATLAEGEEVTLSKQEGKVEFAKVYNANYEQNSYFNLLTTDNGYEVVAGVFGVNGLYGKSALYVNDKLVAVANGVVINGSRMLMKYNFNSNEPPQKVQVVFANNEGGKVNFLATKNYNIGSVASRNVIMKNTAASGFSFPAKLVKDSTGVTYKPAIQVETWNAYTSDDVIKVGGVVYWTTQEMEGTWAIYANENLVYQGPVTRNGGGMSMHYGDITLPAGTYQLQAVFASNVNGEYKYGISSAVTLTVKQGSAKPASLKVNVAKPAFTATFTPQVTVNGVTKDAALGSSVVFDGLAAGKTYTVTPSKYVAGDKVYEATVDKASVVASATTIEEVNVTYTEKTVVLEYGSVALTLENPAFATTIFTPSIKVNGVEKAVNWGETVKLTKLLAGDKVTVTAGNYSNADYEYVATVTPAEAVIEKNVEKAVKVSYAERENTLPSARPWEAGFVYNAGDIAYYNGNIYECTGWSQGSSPDQSPQWKLVGPGVEDKGYIWKGGTERPAELDKKKIVMYFPEWGIYGGHKNYYPHLVPFEKITHLYYAFATIKNGEISHFDFDAAVNQSMGGHTDWAGKDSGNLGQLRLLQKEYPNISVLVSVGGWSQSANFPIISATAEGRKKFADSCVAYLRKWKFDGVDIDWEFAAVEREPDTIDNPNDQGNPNASPADKHNFTLLLKDLRAALTKAGEEDGRYYQLTTAVNASAEKVKYTEPGEYSKYVDFINLMTYDLHGAWDPMTGHHSALKPNPNDPHTGLTVVECMENFLAFGIPKEKLVIGSPFYSRGWMGVKNDGPEPVKTPGLFGSAEKGAKGVWDGGVPAGNNPYYHLLEMEKDPRFKKYRDPYNNSPYLYSEELGEFYTYEDESSLKDKVDFVNQNQYGGIIVWEITGDAPARGGTALLDVIYNGFRSDLAQMDFNLK